MRKFLPWLVALGAVVIIGGWMASSYNSFVDARASVDQAWGDVQVQYQRRSDLIPNLVSVVQQGANVERGILQSVTEARSAWAQARQAGSRSEQIQAAEGIDSALSRLLVTVEAYPQLQSIQGFRDLQTQVEGTENRIATARRDYNGAVGNYNRLVQRVPARLVAGLFGFDPEPFFEAAEGSDKAPVINFSSSADAASSLR